MNPYREVYNLVKKIPKGKVATYGQIGQLTGLDPRVVGWALNKLANWRTGKLASWRNRREPVRQFASSPALAAVPWHRVINSKGGISTNRVMNIPLGLQKVLLEKEGIKFTNDKISLKDYRWIP